MLGWAFLSSASFYLAILLRFRFVIPAEMVAALWSALSLNLLFKLPLGWFCRFGKQQFLTVSETHRFIGGTLLAGFALFLANLTLMPSWNGPISRSVIVLDAVIFLVVCSIWRSMRVPLDQATVPDSRWKMPLGFAGCLLVFSFVALFISVGSFVNSAGGSGHRAWFGGDNLFPVHIVEDVLVDGNSISGWLFPPAPCVFPDILFAAIARLATTNPASTMLLTGCLLVSLIFASAVYAAALVSRSRQTLIVLMSLAASGVVLFMACTGMGSSVILLFWPACHCGVLGLSLFLSVAGIHVALDRHLNRSLFGLISLVSFCAGFSDLFIVAYFCVPLTVVLTIGWLMNLVTFRRGFLVNSLVWSSTIAGVIASRRLLRMRAFGDYSHRSIESIAKVAQIMLEGLLKEISELSPLFVFSLLWMAAVGLWCATTLYMVARNRSQDEELPLYEQRRFLLLLCLGLSGPATLCALIAGGNYTAIHDGFSCAVRYLQPMIFTPLFFWPLLIPESMLVRIRLVVPTPVYRQLAVAVLLAGLGGLGFFGANKPGLRDFVPHHVAKLDEIASERGLKEGVAFYWTARDVNLFSRNKLRIIPVDVQMQYFDWMNNRECVSDLSRTPPCPEFVILSPTETYSREIVLGYFGQPADEIPLDETGTQSVLIYDRQQDAALHHLFGRSIAIAPQENVSRK